MPSLRTKAELAALARSYASLNDLVVYKQQLYLPIDFETLAPQPVSADRTVWSLLDQDAIQLIANVGLSILFATDAEERSFTKMLKQFALRRTAVTGILIRTVKDGLQLLKEDGKLYEPTGDFVSNFINVPYDPESPLIDELFATIADWTGGEDEADSLLYHIATALQPTWSAVKYVLLIGEGRNGKGTLLKMIQKLFGARNISRVTRQRMAATSSTMTSMNGKLINLVMDGPKEFLKDSSTEKTIIAGEPIDIEIKYENAPVTIETNALFMEALNTEPVMSDKSPAAQKRLVRFFFGNIYEDDLEFLDRMLSDEMIAALLHLLLTHWVNKNELADKLRATARSVDLQLEAVWRSSPVLRYIESYHTRDAKFIKTIIDGKMQLDTFIHGFREWMGNNGYKNSEDDYLHKLVGDAFKLDRKTFRIDGKPTSRRYLKEPMPDTANALQVIIKNTDTSDIDVLAD